MVTAHRGRDGRLLVVCKGAPEAVLALLADGAPAASSAAGRLAEAGLRVLAVAAATVDSGSAAALVADPTGLRLLGLLGIGDPVRAEAAGIARDFEAAGIRLVLITGDHPGTATAIGRTWASGATGTRSTPATSLRHPLPPPTGRGSSPGSGRSTSSPSWRHCSWAATWSR